MPSPIKKIQGDPKTKSCRYQRLALGFIYERQRLVGFFQEASFACVWKNNAWVLDGWESGPYQNVVLLLGSFQKLFATY